MKKNLLIAVLLIVLCGCKKDEPMAPPMVAPDVTGSWSGIIRNTRDQSMSLEFAITQDGNKIEGFGSRQMTGSTTKAFYDVTGSLNGNNVHLIFEEITVFFTGTVSSASMSGKTSGLAKEEQVTFIRKP